MTDNLPDWKKNVRENDPETSKRGAKDVRLRSDGHKFKLLSSYAWTGDSGLTDEEAATHSGLIESSHCCWWKRSSELRRLGYIAHNGNTKVGASGTPRMVCKITDAGIDAFENAAKNIIDTERNADG